MMDAEMLYIAEPGDILLWFPLDLNPTEPQQRALTP